MLDRVLLGRIGKKFDVSSFTPRRVSLPNFRQIEEVEILRREELGSGKFQEIAKNSKCSADERPSSIDRELGLTARHFSSLVASPLFLSLPSSVTSKMDKFQKRAHPIICGIHCTCTNFPPLSHVCQSRAIFFFNTCEQFPCHPLHHLIPPRLPRSLHYRLPHVSTTRRLQSFIPSICISLNSMKWISLCVITNLPITVFHLRTQTVCNFCVHFYHLILCMIFNLSNIYTYLGPYLLLLKFFVSLRTFSPVVWTEKRTLLSSVKLIKWQYFPPWLCSNKEIVRLDGPANFTEGPILPSNLIWISKI